MNKVFLDSNIFLRYFVPDNEEKYADCVSLLKLVDQGVLRSYTSPIVFLECYFVLTRQYTFPDNKVQSALTEISSIRNISIVKSIDTQKALKMWQETGVKLADCLIATQVGKGIVLCTYDREFKKIPSLMTIEPSAIVEKIHKTP